AVAAPASAAAAAARPAPVASAVPASAAVRTASPATAAAPRAAVAARSDQPPASIRGPAATSAPFRKAAQRTPIMTRVLLAEDGLAAEGLLTQADAETTVTHTLAETLLALHDRPVDVVLLYLDLPDSRGLGTLLALKGAYDGPVVVITPA